MPLVRDTTVQVLLEKPLNPKGRIMKGSVVCELGDADNTPRTDTHLSVL